jgi:hypothetical protein
MNKTTAKFNNCPFGSIVRTLVRKDNPFTNYPFLRCQYTGFNLAPCYTAWTTLPAGEHSLVILYDLKGLSHQFEAGKRGLVEKA